MTIEPTPSEALDALAEATTEALTAVAAVPDPAERGTLAHTLREQLASATDIAIGIRNQAWAEEVEAGDRGTRRAIAARSGVTPTAIRDALRAVEARRGPMDEDALRLLVARAGRITIGQTTATTDPLGRVTITTPSWPRLIDGLRALREAGYTAEDTSPTTPATPGDGGPRLRVDGYDPRQARTTPDDEEWQRLPGGDRAYQVVCPACGLVTHAALPRTAALDLADREGACPDCDTVMQVGPQPITPIH